MPAFYNPYHFIPVSQIRSNTTAYDLIAQGDHTFIRHDLWSDAGKSGVIKCTLTLKSPTIVGNEQTVADPQSTDRQETRVNQYSAPATDEAAIPANSLRGMIASMTETLSQSAIRVLDNKHYSVRQGMTDAISAIGLVEKTPQGEWQLRPLCLPTLSQQTDQAPWQEVFKHIPLRHCLQVYTEVINDRTSYQGKQSPELYHLALDDMPDESTYYQGFNQLPVYDSMKMKTMENRRTGKTLFFCLGLKTQSALQNLKPQPCQNTLSGGFYILNPNRNDGVRKYHHRFISISDKYHFSEQHKCLQLSQKVVDNLNNTMASRVANQNKNEAWQLPYLPEGYQLTAENRSRTDKRRGYRQLQEGDLIGFSIDRSGQVDHLSYSSIWRNLAQNSTFDSFTLATDNDITPWGSKQRSTLTVAETLFGVVEELKDTINDNPSNHNHSTRNLAARVRFTDAIKADGPVQRDAEITLPKLSAPKPPSPAFYFEGKPGSKAQFAGNKKVKPKGRMKYYLPHKMNRSQSEASDLPQWQSQLADIRHEDYLKNPDLHMKARPLSSGQAFHFEVSFDSLSEAELGLLLCALGPSDYFVHRLGLGKPLGLGQIQLHTDSIAFIDRAARYSQNSFTKSSPRFSEEWHAHDTPQQALPLLMQNGGLVDANTLAVIQLLGDPANQQDNTPVSYPFATDFPRRGNRPPEADQQPYSELELFKWSAANYDTRANKPQYLQDFKREYQPIKTANNHWFQDGDLLADQLEGISLRSLNSSHERVQKNNRR